VIITTTIAREPCTEPGAINPATQKPKGRETRSTGAINHASSAARNKENGGMGSTRNHTLSAWAADGVPAEEQRATRSAGEAPWRAAAVARGGVDRMVESSGQRRSACVVGIVAAGTAAVAPPSALDTRRE